MSMVPMSPYALSGSDQALLARPALLGGFTVRESGGSNAVSIVIYDNASAGTGTIVGAKSLAAGVADTITFTRPINCVNGLYVDVIGTGTLVGSVFAA